MHKTSAEVRAYFEAFGRALGNLGVSTPSPDQTELLFAVPYTLLSEAKRSTTSLTRVQIAAQNFHWEEQGAYTGEISLPMLRDIGIHASLIGHSERRQYFAESDTTVSNKLRAALRGGTMPIVCIGETLQERQGGQTAQVIERQFAAAFAGVDAPLNTVIAYEPVWAIGTGLSASNAEAQEVHAQIRRLLSKRYGAAVADAMRLLYGGSANPSNIEGLLQEPDIDGCLVGGASLKPDDFAKMAKIAQ